MTFFAKEQFELIESVLSSSEMPDGVKIRTVDFEDDIKAIQNLPMDDDDTIVPVYGMVAEDCADELTLIATRDGNPIGQISVSLELRDSDFLELDLFFNGIFVSDDERGKHIGTTLGKVAVDIMMLWLKKACLDTGKLPGGITVGGDTLPGSAGAAVEKFMQNYADQLCEELEEHGGV